MRPLLVVTCGTVVYRVYKDIPCLKNSRVINAVTCTAIVFYPIFFRETLWAPWQLAHHLEHDGVVLYSLHCEADTFYVFRERISLGLIEIIKELVHPAVQPDIGPEILKETEEPWMVTVSFFTLPDRRYSPHRAAFREKVKDKDITCCYITQHLRTWILRPSLDNPYTLRITTLHGFEEAVACLCIIN